MDNCAQRSFKITGSNPFNVTEHDLYAFFASVRFISVPSSQPEPPLMCDPLVYITWFFEGAPQQTIHLINNVFKHVRLEFTYEEQANLMRMIIRQNLSEPCSNHIQNAA